ncbi:MAG: DUF3877 family protein [Lachnospiraceae bacterium]|nr:DUF3877 family protein [Lachnospiraceae bacterium]
MNINNKNRENLIKNITDQIKEAQVKLGYAKETMRFYYPVSSLNEILGTDYPDEKIMAKDLNANEEMKNTVLGELKFETHGGRIEISVPPKGVEYVWQNVEASMFLLDLINLFKSHHHCELSDITKIFHKYSDNFQCEKMPEGMDFDYVIYFTESGIDEYYYCIKMEMGHTIYHRFTREDYEMMFV